MGAYLLLSVLSAAYGQGINLLAGRVMASDRSFPGLSRKIFHVGIFSGAVPAHLVLGFWGVVVYGSVLSLLILLGVLQGRGSGIHDRMTRDGDEGSEVGAILWPLLWTAVGGLLGAVLVGNLAVVGYLVCGWGDAAGEIVGRRFGRRRYPSPFGEEMEQRRSIEGSVAVFLAGAAGGALALLLLGGGAEKAVFVGSACGFVGAVTEALSGHRTDNFWVQLLPSVAAWWMVVRITV